MTKNLNPSIQQFDQVMNLWLIVYGTAPIERQLLLVVNQLTMRCMLVFWYTLVCQVFWQKLLFFEHRCLNLFLYYPMSMSASFMIIQCHAIDFFYWILCSSRSIGMLYECNCRTDLYCFLSIKSMITGHTVHITTHKNWIFVLFSLNKACLWNWFNPSLKVWLENYKDFCSF